VARHARRSAHARPSPSGELISRSAEQASRGFAALRRASVVQVLGLAAIGLALATAIPAFATSNADAADQPPAAAQPAPVNWTPAASTNVASAPPLAPSITDVSTVIKAQTKERRTIAKAKAARAAARQAVAAKKVAAIKKAAVRKARAAAAAQLARAWVWPLASPTFGARFGAAGPLWASGQHTGQDFPARSGTSVRAAASGVVVFTGVDGPYGNVVHLQHKDGSQTWYGHLSKIVVKKGQKVTTKQQIGNVGSTGNSTGPHLHFEVRPSATAAPIDPLPWMKKRNVVRA